MKLLQILCILLFINLLAEFKAIGQNPIPLKIRLSRITFLTANLDSLTRSYLKKGFRIKSGKREPGGVFSNTIILQDRTEITLETTFSGDSSDWRVQALKRYGNHISGITFEADSLFLLYQLLQNNIPVSPIDSILGNRTYGTYKTHGFALDSCEPLDVVFLQRDSSTEIASAAFHPNHVFRVDWMLLSASPIIENRIRKLFEITGALKQHEGCCDYWRIGPSDDFCFFRFEPLLPKAKGKDDWLSIEPDGVYFAY